MQREMKYVFLSVCLLSICNVKYNHQVDAMGMAGPADITLERWEDCDSPEKYQVPMGVTMTKLNRSHAGISGCMDLGCPMDETVIIQIDVAKWGDGGWKPNALNYGGPACDTVMKYIQPPWESFIKTAGFDEVVCPLPQEKYCIDKVAFDLTGLFPSMLYGYFRADATLTIKDVPYRCLRIYVKSDPANKSG